MHINLIELWSNMGLPVRCVVFLLTIQAVACVGVSIDRAILLYTSGARARQFAAEVQGPMKANDHAKILQAIEVSRANHLSDYLGVGLRTFLELRQAGETAGDAAEYARRALERKGEAVSRDLNRRMNVLASTGSTAPFVGLLGTVLGIINAFGMIAASGSGGIATIGAAIGEALVVTGYGLVVAIPSVLVFNGLAGRIATFEGGLLNAGGELVDRLARSAGATTASSLVPGSSGAPFSTLPGAMPGVP
jgi:biopolymer transport protein ExbB/TolQ